MTADKLALWIDALTNDIEFDYLGIQGAICPFSRTDIALSYGDASQTFSSVEEAMQAPFFVGKSLQEISGHLNYYLAPSI